MTTVRRALLVVGALLMLGTAFVWPPRYVLANGTRLSIEQCIDGGGEATQRECRALAHPDGSLLLSYLLAIGGVTIALAYATRPRM